MFPHFLLIAIDLLFIGIKNKKVLYISMIMFAVSLYCYGVAIYFVPFFLLAISIYLSKKNEISKKDIIICILIFFIIAMPIIIMFAINALHIEQDIKIGNITIPYYKNLSRTGDMIFFSQNPFKQLINNINSTIKVIFTRSRWCRMEFFEIVWNDIQDNINFCNSWNYKSNKINNKKRKYNRKCNINSMACK